MQWLGFITRKKIAGDAVAVATSQLTVVLARLIGLRLVTELAPPGEYGKVTLVLGAAALASGVFLKPVLEAVWRFSAEADAEGRSGAFRVVVERLIRNRLVLACCTVVTGAVIWDVLTHATWTRSALLVAFLMLSDAVRLFEINVWSAARRHGAAGLLIAGDEILRQGCGVAFLLAFGPTAESILGGFTVGSLLATLAGRRLFSLRTLRQQPAPDYRLRLQASIAAYVRPLPIIATLNWATSLSDRYLLAALVSASATGVYAATYGIASQPFIVAAGILTRVLRPIVNTSAVSGDVTRERTTVWVWLGATAAMTLIGGASAYLIAPYAFDLLLDDRFHAGPAVFAWVAAAYGVQAIQGVFETLLLTQQRTRRIFLSHLFGAVAAVTAYAVLIPEMGLLGAAVGSFLSLSVACLVACFASEFPQRALRGGSFGAV